jgi:hypothetical protein
VSSDVSPERAGRGVRDRPLHSSELPDAVACPFCDGLDTEQFSTFGGQVSTSQYYCNPCRTVFDCFRWR